MKIQNIQALRGIAVLSIILFHLIIIEKKYGGEKAILSDFLDFSMFGVDLFFVISGFIMVTVTRGKFQNMKHGLNFLYHRVSRIYPTYWVYSSLVLLIFLIAPSLVNSSQGNQVNILASFLLLPSNHLPLVMVGWTLIHEMYFYLVFSLILFLVSEKRMPVAIFLWGAIVVFLNITLESNNPFVELASHPLTLEFIGGCFLAKIYFSQEKTKIKNRSLVAFLLIGLIISLYQFYFYHQITGATEPLGWWRVLIFGPFSMLLVFCFVNIEKNGLILHSFLIKIGDASYSIYLSHILTLSAIGKLWGAFENDTIYDNILAIPTLFILAIIIGIASHTFIEKPLLKLTRRVL